MAVKGQRLIPLWLTRLRAAAPVQPLCLCQARAAGDAQGRQQQLPVHHGRRRWVLQRCEVLARGMVQCIAHRGGTAVVGGQPAAASFLLVAQQRCVRRQRCTVSTAVRAATAAGARPAPAALAHAALLALPLCVGKRVLSADSGLATVGGAAVYGIVRAAQVGCSSLVLVLRCKATLGVRAGSEAVAGAHDGVRRCQGGAKAVQLHTDGGAPIASRRLPGVRCASHRWACTYPPIIAGPVRGVQPPHPRDADLRAGHAARRRVWLVHG